MSALQIQRQRRTMYPRGEVACRKCAAPIYIYKLNALADEFSVHCSRCGDRGIYMKKTIAIKEMPERRKKPRK